MRMTPNLTVRFTQRSVAHTLRAVASRFWEIRTRGCGIARSRAHLHSASERGDRERERALLLSRATNILLPLILLILHSSRWINSRGEDRERHTLKSTVACENDRPTDRIPDRQSSRTYSFPPGLNYRARSSRADYYENERLQWRILVTRHVTRTPGCVCVYLRVHLYRNVTRDGAITTNTRMHKKKG